MRIARIYFVVGVLLPTSGALSGPSLAPGRTIRFAAPDDLAQVAQLQLDAFDPAPAPAPPRKNEPSFLASFMKGVGGDELTMRAERAARLADELASRLSKGSDIWVVEESPSEGTPASLLGTADLSEQEMLLPTHSLAEGLYLCSMAVSEDVRRQGIGRLLLGAAEQQAACRGAAAVYLHVERANVAAVGLYEACGYSRLPETQFYNSFTAALNLRHKDPLLLCKEL
jgi:ribosomal protein S18 acetylase RimI-like enzyme